MSEDFDFGWSFEEDRTETLQANVTSAGAEVAELEEERDKFAAKVLELRKAIDPFLTTLRDSAGDVIKWPADIRKEKVNEFMERLDLIVDNT